MAIRQSLFCDAALARRWPDAFKKMNRLQACYIDMLFINLPRQPASQSIPSILVRLPRVGIEQFAYSSV
jgi:hypothetical protein